MLPKVASKEEVGNENWPLIQKLASARLLVTNRKDTGEEMVEVIHEALIQHWQQLRQWLDESRANLLQKRRIDAAANEWHQDGRYPSDLFLDKRLINAKNFRDNQGKEFPLSRIAEEFIEAGIRQNTKKKIQILGSILIIPTLGMGISWIIWNQIQMVNQQLESRLSLGEKIFFASHVNKRSGSEFFANGNFPKAIDKFQESIKDVPNDPEALIYLNNAKGANQNPLTIAVSVPFDKVPNVAQEILRGVAQAQNEVNQVGGINGKLLQVEIGNDDNNPKIAQDIAGKLIRDSKILAVVGHNASNVSRKGAEIYQDHLVMISPTSFALDFQEIKKPQEENYIFRTVNGYKVLLPKLADYITKTIKNPKLLICYDPEAFEQKWLIDGFSQNIKIKLAKTDCNFSNPNLDLDQVLRQGIKERANGLFLTPHVSRINEGINLATANRGRLKLFGSATLYTIDTLKLGQQNVKGLVLSVYWRPGIFPGSHFDSNADKLWRKNVMITWRTAMAYDATKVIIEGLKKIPSSQSPSRIALQKILSNPEFEIEGATGKVQFLPSGERKEQQSFLVEVCPGTKTGTGYDFVPLGTCQKK